MIVPTFMKSFKHIGWPVLLLFSLQAVAAPALQTSRVHVANGILEGVISADDKVRTFKGIPYAAPPVGPLRWKDPQPAAAWEGVRPASEYGARCMQGAIYADMVFHDNGPSEDCLYLNLWMPAHPATPPSARHGLDLRRRLRCWLYL